MPSNHAVVIALVVVYAVASRLAYVIWVGRALTRQRTSQWFTRHEGVETGFATFKRTASRIMTNDAVSFILLVLVTRDTLRLPVPRAIVLLVSALLIVIGIGTKLWAAARLGPDAYYWHNFFSPGEHHAPDPPGPYRYIDNPMYTVGYLQTWGFALALGSAWGLAAAAFFQAAVLVFNRVVEKPHYDAVVRGDAA